jgi:hypothetical protein
MFISATGLERQIPHWGSMFVSATGLGGVEGDEPVGFALRARTRLAATLPLVAMGAGVRPALVSGNASGRLGRVVGGLGNESAAG